MSWGLDLATARDLLTDASLQQLQDLGGCSMGSVQGEGTTQIPASPVIPFEVDPHSQSVCISFQHPQPARYVVLRASTEPSSPRLTRPVPPPACIVLCSSSLCAFECTWCQEC